MPNHPLPVTPLAGVVLVRGEWAMTKRIAAVALLVVAAFPAAAAAETLTIETLYPAPNDGTAALDSIAVDRIGGEEGARLTLALEDALGGVSYRGERWVRVVPASIGADAEALLRGAVYSDVTVSDSYDREENRCAEEDERGKCVRREKVKVPCWQQTVRIDPDLRLTRRDGATLWFHDERLESSKRWCRGDTRPSSDPEIRNLADELAHSVRAELLPAYRREDVRVMESRKGLEGADRDAFRSAVRLTKSSEDAACDSFAALEEGNPAHPSVLFNVGLCRERDGRLDEAEEFYERALVADSGADYAASGLDRIAQHRRGLMQADSRFR